MTSVQKPPFYYSLAYGAMIIGLPFLVWYCFICVYYFGGAVQIPNVAFWRHISGPGVTGAALYIGWVSWQALLYHFLPGKIEWGQPLADGSRLDYRLNGLFSFCLTIGVWLLLHITGLVSGSYLYRHLPDILGVANVLVFMLCIYVYFLGRAQATEQEQQRHWLEAFFLGAALNPRSGKFDWKFFCEARPGLTLWVLIALSCVVHQYETHGVITNAMLLSCFFICLYIVDYYVVEDALLTTWDIVHEPFGWMLCWGSLVYVPFFYPLGAIWLANNPYVLPGWAALAIFILGSGGYFIFRQANIQKHHFRKNLGKKIWGKDPEFIQTKRGTRLLISGWWGIASHANYLGDLMLALAMGLVVANNTVFAYAYVGYFVVLLLHRDWRDDQHCANKYGDDWVTYRRKVRWHIFPGIY